MKKTDDTKAKENLAQALGNVVPGLKAEDMTLVVNPLRLSPADAAERMDGFADNYSLASGKVVPVVAHDTNTSIFIGTAGVGVSDIVLESVAAAIHKLIPAVAIPKIHHTGKDGSDAAQPVILFAGPVEHLTQLDPKKLSDAIDTEIEERAKKNLWRGLEKSMPGLKPSHLVLLNGEHDFDNDKATAVHVHRNNVSPESMQRGVRALKTALGNDVSVTVARDNTGGPKMLNAPLLVINATRSELAHMDGRKFSDAARENDLHM